MITVLHLAALALYAGAAGMLAFFFARQRSLPWPAVWLSAAGAGVHFAALAAFTAEWGELPLVGLGPALTSLAFLVGVGSVVAAAAGKAGPVGLVLEPLAALLVAAALTVGVRPAAEELNFRGIWFVLHVLMALFGYVGLAVAFAAGLMYLLQFRELKGKRFGAIFRFFPPLNTLDRLGRRGVLVGFPFLTLALAIGWAWTIRFRQPLGAGNPKVIWGVLSWVVLLAALLARAGGGSRERRAAIVSVLGFVVVVVMYVVLRVQEHGGVGFL